MAEFNSFVQVISRQLQLPMGSVSLDTSLRDDLLLDSISVYEFLLALEDICAVTLPEELFNEIETLGDAFGWYEHFLGQP